MNSIIRIFFNNASSIPDQTALELPDHDISYIELCSQVENMTSELKTSGITKGSVVAYLGRSKPATVVTLLSCLNLNAVFFPIDSSLPEDKKESIIDSVNISLMLNDSSEMRDFGELPSVDIDPLSGKFKSAIVAKNVKLKTENVEVSTLFFTSGSTGKPKGIFGGIKDIFDFVNWEISELELNSNDRFCQLTNISFDAILRDYLCPLLCGATIVFPSEEIRNDLSQLYSWLKEKQINCLHTVPSVLKAIIVDQQPEINLRRLALSGEVLTLEFIQEIKKSLKPNKIYNFYGPSETMMIKTFIEVSDLTINPIPLGQPIDGAEVLILDDDLEECRSNEIGEICISTMNTFPCYIETNENDEKYIYFESEAGAQCFYKTGDMGWYNIDGELYFEGRIDDEIKVNGQRVNLNEIKLDIESISGISEFCVVSQYSDHNHIISAFYEKKEKVSVNPNTIVEKLSKKYTSSIIPNIYGIESFPKLNNGKIDKAMLSKMAQNHKEEPSSFVKPKNGTQKLIYDVWCQVLKKEKFGIDDNFFMIGGHSLLATITVSKIRMLTNSQIPLVSFIQNPTIRELSEVLDEATSEMVENMTEEELLKLI